MRAVGLFFSTQGGNTESAANTIASAAGLEAKEIRDAGGPSILSSLDGIIVGTPTWHTGADEMRSGTSWDDYLDEIRSLKLDGKPVAVFGLGDSSGYGDNFVDAIEELHNTFEAAGAKMLGYVPDSGYEYYADSKSVRDGKFLGLPLDADNEDDQTEARVNDWLKQLGSEGMPGMPR
jgi:flavodoxin I